VRSRIKDSKLSQLVLIVPHVTLGDSTIIFDSLRQILLQKNSFKVSLIVNERIASTYSNLPLSNHNVIVTRMNFWKYSNGRILPKVWRLCCYICLLPSILRINGLSLGSNVLFLGPDWITNSSNSTDLFSSIFTRMLSRKFIPISSKRSTLLELRRKETITHRDFIYAELSLIGVLKESLDRHISCPQKTPSMVVINFLRQRGVFGQEFLLCFLGAGDPARDWTSQNVETILGIAKSANLKTLFIGETEVQLFKDFSSIFEIISLSKVCLTNDTGWAHLVIAMTKPLVAISPIPNPLQDLYLQSSKLVKVVRPKLSSESDVNLQPSVSHCISQIRNQDIAKAILEYKTRSLT
jgi:hypothetical protein